MMDTRTYRSSEKLTGAVIVLGSHQPTKVWAKVRFGKNGDLYWMPDTVKDVDRTDEHVSLHRSGEVWSTMQGQRHRTTGSDDSSLNEIQSGTECLEEGYLYQWLPTFLRKDAKEQIAVCLDPHIVGSTLRSSVDLFNGQDSSAVDNVISKRLDTDDHRSHALVFPHQGRTLIVCFQFHGGMGPIEQAKVRQADSSAHDKKKLFVFDKMKIS